MQRFFVDTFYWIALISRHDTWHRHVRIFNRSLRYDDRFLTTDAVIVELLATFSDAGPYLRHQAVTHVEAMLANPFLQVIEVARPLLLEGITLYKNRPDKGYSLTDCISMQVMRQAELTDVLTNDHHFTQEGFRILFP